MSTELCLGMIKELVQNLSFFTPGIVRKLEENKSYYGEYWLNARLLAEPVLSCFCGGGHLNEATSKEIQVRNISSLVGPPTPVFTPNNRGL